MQAAADQQSQPLETEVRSPEQDVGAATGAAGVGPLGPGVAALPATAGQVLSNADVVKAATKALSAVGSGGRGAGSSSSSGLMIDGFLVPPHVLQALQVHSVADVAAVTRALTYLFACTHVCLHLLSVHRRCCHFTGSSLRLIELCKELCKSLGVPGGVTYLALQRAATGSAGATTAGGPQPGCCTAAACSAGHRGSASPAGCCQPRLGCASFRSQTSCFPTQLCRWWFA